MKKHEKCQVHDVPLICPICTGSLGGSQRSNEKANAARRNGKLGGRPRKEGGLKATGGRQVK